MRVWGIVLALLFATGSAWAGPTCNKEPKAKWISQADMKAKLADSGYKFSVFKVTAGNCYEIYGRNKAGKRVEIYFHPVTGQAVEQH